MEVKIFTGGKWRNREKDNNKKERGMKGEK